MVTVHSKLRQKTTFFPHVNIPLSNAHRVTLSRAMMGAPAVAQCALMCARIRAARIRKLVVFIVLQRLRFGDVL